MVRKDLILIVIHLVRSFQHFFFNLLLLPLALQPAVGFGLPIFPYLSPTLCIFSLPALEDLRLLHTVLQELEDSLQSIISLSFPFCNMVCMFHVAMFLSVYLVLFSPSSLNLSSLLLYSTFVMIRFFSVWGC
jgi:hypothetical protein